MKTLLPCELSPQSPSLPFIRQFYVKQELCGLRRMETLYARLEDEYELKERATTLADKVETVQNTASVLTDLIDAQRSLRLEVTVVLLIAVEIGITFYDLYFRHQ